ncbi:response regulator [Jeotgalibaca sp. MA1X17-3]|uniref:response regulator n=1 Tax=Jeotgalibaca sp. MA1X17-3 TaxID=2908211 RepID=UPI001F2210D0|nr:response regulator [Jeotgalibaca sp. MA1X17-3]UJF15298.1 response regulator [Jeotgalibaca sp. MA1X17-3]
MYRVLIVEDEYIIRKGMIYGFNYEKWDCVVVGEASNGQEGIQKIKELQPDIVITDINMPIKNAFQMFEETMEFPYSAIIVSGYDEFVNAQKAIQYGVSEFIVKPIESEQFEKALQRAQQQCEINQHFTEKKKRQKRK